MCVHAGWCGRAVQRLEAQQAASKFPFIGQILVPAFHLGARARRLARESAAVQRLEAQQAEALSALAPALGGSQPPDGAEQQQLPGARRHVLFRFDMAPETETIAGMHALCGSQSSDDAEEQQLAGAALQTKPMPGRPPGVGLHSGLAREQGVFRQCVGKMASISM